jgi:hypothetical protein
MVGLGLIAAQRCLSSGASATSRDVRPASAICQVLHRPAIRGGQNPLHTLGIFARLVVVRGIRLKPLSVQRASLPSIVQGYRCGQPISAIAVCNAESSA